MGWATQRCPQCQFLALKRGLSKIRHIIFRALVALIPFVLLVNRLVACRSRVKVEQTDTQTDRPSTVTLAHARRGLMKSTKVQTLGAYCISCVLCQCACIVHARGSVRNYTHAHYL